MQSAGMQCKKSRETVSFIWTVVVWRPPAFLLTLQLIPPFFCAKVATYAPTPASHWHASQCMFWGTRTHFFFANQFYWILATIGAHPLATQAVHVRTYTNTLRHTHTHQYQQIMSSAFCSPPSVFPFLHWSHLHTQVRSWCSEIVLSWPSAAIWAAHTALSHPERREGARLTTLTFTDAAAQRQTLCCKNENVQIATFLSYQSCRNLSIL